MNHWTAGLDSIYFVDTTIKKYILELSLIHISEPTRR